MPSFRWIVICLDRKYPRGLYQALGHCLKSLEESCSLNQKLITKVNTSFGISRDSRWIPEVYQCISLGMAVLLLVFVSFGFSSWGYIAGPLALCVLTTLLFFVYASSLCLWLGCLFAVFMLYSLFFVYLFDSSLRLTAWLIRFMVLYRLFDITLFAVNWVFVHAPWLLSSKRSLVGFIINIAEVVIFYTVTYISFGCIDCSQAASTLAALYSSLRTTVTIGPISGYELPKHWLCVVFLMTQIVISYFLAIVVIADVIGLLPKRDESLPPPSTQTRASWPPRSLP